jgi:predicted AlkP superfamily phosphohydrolase/phosphomutase
MKVSIRTAYRIVKHIEDEDRDIPIYIPQYQEEGSEDWHNFRTFNKGTGRNTVYFYIKSRAKQFIHQKQATQDVVVYFHDLIENVEENYS